MNKCKRFVSLWILLIGWLGGLNTSLAFAEQWKIGVLAQRGSAHTHTRWQPWIDWLNSHFAPTHQFSLVTLDLDDLENDQAQNVDFALTNQAQFFYLNDTDVRWLVSLKSLRQSPSIITDRIGSAIFVRSDSRFQRLTDLAQKRISAVSAKAFGGFLLGYNEFYKQGLSEDDVKLTFTGFPIESPLLRLQENKADAAIVPTCIFEELTKEGALKATNFRLLSPIPNQMDCLASTPLLPNWSLAALPQVPMELASQLVTLLLGEIPPQLPQWTPPYSTRQADTILRQIDKHPKQNLWQLTKFWLQKYQVWIVSLALLLVLNYLWISFQVHRKSKALQQAHREMRYYEQQLTQTDRLSLLGEMSTGIAHEINQPLSAIRMYVEGMKYQLNNRAENPQEAVILDKILLQVDRSAEIIRNLMNWAKGKNDGNAERVALKTVLQRSIQFIALSHSQPYEIRLSCPESLTVHLKTIVLEQIMCNCLRNAIQAHATRIEIVVKVQQNSLMIYLQDNGKGFSEEELTFSFVPFRTDKPDGLGLGLVLCQRLIRSLNGEIRLQNRANQSGAEVILTLPYYPKKREKENADSPC